ncbi:preprotein translocase, SecA subunit [Corynebacterium matruchotii ATCC 33806]|jgi:preprotein translocase, secA subunit|nr:preprotein translocase, SecA subunit [Corynebacterium matruchotii ATCC 33806]
MGEGRKIKRLQKIAEEVLALEPEMADLTDEELKAKTDEFKERIADGETVDDLLYEAFAVAREASYRVLGQKHYLVQVMGGAALHFGGVAEMRTGEGKTLTCVLPAYLNALEGKGVHVVTVNDYLAKRDAEWMGRVHRFLGLKVGVILSNMTPEERKTAYDADITYGTNNELGFDYLRDNMVHSLSELVQRGHHYAIVDEVDSILIDEARTPLIISGPADGPSQLYTTFAALAPRMREGIHYEVDHRKRTVGVKEEGVEFVENQLGIENLYAPENSQLVSYLNNAIKAKELFTKDKDYIVSKGEVLIVDDFTGRVLEGRRYNEGMHQAIEAKEGVEIKNENQTLATITLQNYFRLYDKLAGMTGTAETEAAELHQIYKLDVMPIPTNKKPQRVDMTDLVYKTQEAKFAAVVQDIAERVAKGQPVLVGTTSVERSEYLSKLLQRRHIKHNVLNAKFHEQEAQIIARAGLPGQVTVATNMAGRGTDIVLGGNPDIIADINLRERGLDPIETPEEYEAAWDEELEKVKEKAKKEAEKVRKAGGLYVLGTERHESRRIDNQLRGRSGRQGDPGLTRFYLSMRDDLMVRFVGQTMENMMNRLNVPDDVPIEAKMVTNSIKGAQAQVENQNFEMRKNVLKYDEVMNEQRKVIYRERREILESADIAANIQAMIDETITAYVRGATMNGYVEDWDLESLWHALETLYGPSMTVEELIDGTQFGAAGELSADDLLEAVLLDAHTQYEQLEEAVTLIGGEAQMRNLERQVILPILDQKWREHLYEMDYLKEGIGLRAMAQRDPLVEYQKEGGEMFDAMKDAIKEETVRQLFMLRKQFQAQAEAMAAAAEEAQA